MSFSISLTVNGVRRNIELEDPRGNLCRCGAYAGITEAVLDAQQDLVTANERRSA